MAEEVSVTVTDTEQFRSMLFSELADGCQDLIDSLGTLKSRENPARNRAVGISQRINRLSRTVEMLGQIGLSEKVEEGEAEIIPLHAIAAGDDMPEAS